MGLKSTLGALFEAIFSISEVRRSPLSTLRISSVFMLLPNMNQVDSTLRPPDSTSRSAPALSRAWAVTLPSAAVARSEEHTSELQSRGHLVCRLLLEIKAKKQIFLTIDALTKPDTDAPLVG